MKLKFVVILLLICFCMVSFLAEVKIFSFWPETMDYSPWFDFWDSKNISEKSMPP